MVSATTRVLPALFPLLVWCNACSAHVKWFSNYEKNRQPVDIAELAEWTTAGLLVLSIVGVFSAKLIAMARSARGRASQSLPKEQRGYVWSAAILRLAAVSGIALAWRNGIVFAPELKYESELIAGLQLLTLVGATQRYGDLALAAGISAMFVLGIAEFGLFHMLDYSIFVGIALFFAFYRPDDPTYRGYGLSALYACVGFSLCWAGLEKLVFPQWAAEVVALHPELALGFPVKFFVSAAAFVEFTIGFLIATQILPALFAAALSCLMAFTATLFGMMEVVGHLIFHAALLCFIVLGPANKPVAPSTWSAAAGEVTRYIGIYLTSFAVLLGIYLLMATPGGDV